MCHVQAQLELRSFDKDRYLGYLSALQILSDLYLAFRRMPVSKRVAFI